MSYRDLSFPHDAVCALSILFVLLGLVVTLLVAEQPQGLRALQLNLKLLRGGREHKIDVGRLFPLHINAENFQRFDFDGKKKTETGIKMRVTIIMRNRECVNTNK